MFSLLRPLFVSVRSILNFIWQDFVRFYVLIIFKREKCLFGTWANSILYRYVSKQPNIILFQVNFLFVWLFSIIKSAFSYRMYTVNLLHARNSCLINSCRQFIVVFLEPNFGRSSGQDWRKNFGKIQKKRPTFRPRL